MTNSLLVFIIVCHIRYVELIKPNLPKPSGFHSKKIHPHLGYWNIKRISYVFYMFIVETLSIYFA
jgi:hypothetical protein